MKHEIVVLGVGLSVSKSFLVICANALFPLSFHCYLFGQTDAK